MNSLRHLGRIELGEWPARAVAGVVDHHVGRTRGIERGEQFVDLRAVAGVALMDLGAGFLRQRGKFIDRARGQRDGQAGLGESARQRGRKTRACADDKSGCVGHYLAWTERTANTMPSRKLSSANTNRTIATQRIVSMVRAGKSLSSR